MLNKTITTIWNFYDKSENLCRSLDFLLLTIHIQYTIDNDTKANCYITQIILLFLSYYSDNIKYTRRKSSILQWSSYISIPNGFLSAQRIVKMRLFPIRLSRVTSYNNITIQFVTGI